MRIQDLYDIDILIDNLSIFSAAGVTLVSADIYEAINNPIPCCKLQLSVPIDWIDTRSIVDGTQIVFTVYCEQYNIDEVYVFRLYNITKMEIEQNFASIQIDGIFDFHDGYRDANQYNGYYTTAEVVNNIAMDTGVESDIDNTSDKQLWVAGENNVYQFLTYLSRYGWVDETSALFWCFDRHGILLYKNLTKLFRTRQKKVWTFIQSLKPDPSKKEFGYSNVTAAILAGTNNLRNEGYGGEDFYFDTQEYAWKAFASRKVVAESNLINISKDLSQGLSDAWYPFDIGNFHKNYYTAFKQNRRILSTYSSYVTVESQFFQPYRLGQIVSFNYSDSNDIGNRLTALSGMFIIDAIHISITTDAISSTAELVMQGLNGQSLTQDVY